MCVYIKTIYFADKVPKATLTFILINEKGSVIKKWLLLICFLDQIINSWLLFLSIAKRLNRHVYHIPLKKTWTYIQIWAKKFT